MGDFEIIKKKKTTRYNKNTNKNTNNNRKK